MKRTRLFAWATTLATCSFACIASTGDITSIPPTNLHAATHLTDTARLWPADAVWLRAAEERLAAFEREQGIRLVVEFHPKSPTEEEDKVPGAYMRALSTKLGLVQRGVLVVYFADEPDWRMWIGDELTARFAGRAGTVEELTQSKAIHETKETLFAAADAKAKAAIAAEPDATPARKLTLHTDALLDGLLAKLRRK